MRTCVRMGRPYRPLREIEGHLEHGSLSFAVAVAKDWTQEHQKLLPLDLALRFLPLKAAEQPEQYESWALRWLMRWISETPGATIDQAADIAVALADLPGEPAAALVAITQASERVRAH